MKKFCQKLLAKSQGVLSGQKLGLVGNFQIYFYLKETIPIISSKTRPWHEIEEAR